jgi:lipopolysaccharide export LptBFGC system permease protein LptF
MIDFNAIFGMMIPIVGAVALFTFLAIASWGEQRRREREAYYRAEVLKKVAEASGASGQAVLAMLHEEEAARLRRRREGLKLGGLITTAVGLGVAVFLGAMVHEDRPVWTVGLIPLFIGLAVLIYALLVAPRPGAAQPNTRTGS